VAGRVEAGVWKREVRGGSAEVGALGYNKALAVGSAWIFEAHADRRESYGAIASFV